MRRVVIVVPSLFTLFNLFFGIWAMVLASRGEFYRAGWYIFFAGILDTQAGRAKRSFIGLPSPAAGMTLATFYPFTTTALYQQVFRVLPRHHLMQFLMILLTILMVSNVRYATLPRAGVRTLRGLLGLA